MPKILASLPNVLEDLLFILKRCLCWKKVHITLSNSTPEEPHTITNWENFDIEIAKLSFLLDDLKSNNYNFVDVKDMKKSLHFLMNQHQNLLSLIKKNSETPKLSENQSKELQHALDQVNIALPIVQNLMTSEEVLKITEDHQERVSPPKELR